MTGVDEDPEARQAAWALYVALHNLAESQTFGQVLTAVPHATRGDIDDVLHQLDQTQAVLNRAHSELIQRVRDAVISWEGRPADRLVGLLPLLDGLGEIAGASLPSLLPPST